MADEDVQERGREGVGMVKAWLEATTWMDFPFNAYEDKTRCTALLLNGKKKFDLRGWHLGDKSNRHEMFVECKRYKTKGAQVAEYQRFLAIAYSFHAKYVNDYGELLRHGFLWVTSNPFKTDGWADLRSEKAINDAVTDQTNAALIGPNHIVDQDIVRLVAANLWLLVFDEDKQIGVTLTSGELKDVMTVLRREGPALWEH